MAIAVIGISHTELISDHLPELIDLLVRIRNAHEMVIDHSGDGLQEIYLIRLLILSICRYIDLVEAMDFFGQYRRRRIYDRTMVFACALK